MKKLVFLFLFFYNSAFTQTTNTKLAENNQLDYFKSNTTDLKNENGSSIFNSDFTFDSLLVITGDSIALNYGASVSSAGDVNGDGYSDIIVGAPGNGGVIGRVYIYFGGVNMDEIADVFIQGIIGSFGASVSTAGDVNGDGFSDVIVGDTYYESGRGRVFVYYGGVSMNNVPDVIMTGENQFNHFGNSVSTAGDVNGDGYSDVIVGASQFDLIFADNIGRAYIYFGGISMNNIPDVIMTGDTAGSVFGSSVSSAGDVNGDGFSDVIVSATGLNLFTGRAYIYFGEVSMNNNPDVTLTGESIYSAFGYSVSSAGDINADGYSDVIVGAYGYANQTGRAYLFYGGVLMNNTADVSLTGRAYSNNFGVSVSSAGDVNGDGFSDLIIGANAYSASTGLAYIYNGGLAMDTIPDVTMTGESAGSSYGNSVSSAGDINDDGYSDVIVGANGYNNYTGRVYICKTLPIIRIRLRLLMEGMYYPIFNQMTRKDTVKVYLRSTESPYEKIDSANAVIDSLSFSNVFNFNNASNGIYYLAVKHFNCIETWSKTGGELLSSDGSIYNYDFTTSNSQSLGNNMKRKGTKYCMYSGNINDDFIIDASDISTVENDVSQGVEGFVRTDLNGDYFVDSDDLSILENNIGVLVITP